MSTVSKRLHKMQQVHHGATSDNTGNSGIQNILFTQEMMKLKKKQCINKYGSKMAALIEYMQDIFLSNEENRVTIFSQYDKMLNIIGKTLDEYQIKNVFCRGQVHCVNKRIDTLLREISHIKVIMLSGEKANSGSNLTEANHIILVDRINADKEKIIGYRNSSNWKSSSIGSK